MAIRVRIVQIGNSRGLRLPKQVLAHAGLGDEVELDVRDDHIVVRPARSARMDWDERFRAMAERGDDALLDADDLVPTRWDETEWEW